MRQVLAVGLVAVLLAGCIPGASNRARSDALEFGKKSQAEAVEVFEAIASGVQPTEYSGPGSSSWDRCADLERKKFKYRATISIVKTRVPTDKYQALISQRVRMKGWDVRDPNEDSGILRASKVESSLVVDYGPDDLLLTYRSKCVGAPRDVAAELMQAPAENFTLEPLR